MGCLELENPLSRFFSYMSGTWVALLVVDAGSLAWAIENVPTCAFSICPEFLKAFVAGSQRE